MYKAILEVGGYKPGATVPDIKAEKWLKQYDVPHVKKVNSKEVKEDKPKVEAPSNDVLIDDYLDRNASVVISNVKGDKLPLEILKKLLAHEKNEKKRVPVIKALEKAIK